MENLAYLHLSFANEDSEIIDLISLRSLCKQAAMPNWKLFSGKAWNYMIPLIITLSILNSVSSVLALEEVNQAVSTSNIEKNWISQIATNNNINSINNPELEPSLTSPIPNNNDSVNNGELEKNWISEIATTNNNDSVKNLELEQSWTSPISISVPSAIPNNNDSVNNGELEKNWISEIATTNNNDSVKNPELEQSLTSPILTTNNQVISTAPTTRTTPNHIISVSNKRKSPNKLVKGDEGSDVRTLQQRLQLAGFYYGNPTGIFGPITEESVKRFQKAYKLTVDGVVGKNTLAKLPALTDENGANAASVQNSNQDTLSLGDRGEAVRILQEQLIKAGFLTNQPNGYYGSNTVDAINRFQKKYQLDTNGIAGFTTRSKLYSVVNNSAKSNFTTLEIQTRLHEKGFYKGQINGIMAEDTKKAISRAQEFYGISLKDVKSGNF
jgi:peptidoglycan hydrolase-like protein with peptidoglycan-binding domain